MRAVHSCGALILALCLLFSSCGAVSPPPAAADILTAMQAALTETAQPLPDGLIYTRTRSPEDPFHFSEARFSALYGEAARGLLAGDEGHPPAVGDAAVFLSAAPYPCEMAVFRCSDVRSAATVAGLCRGRVDTVIRGYAESEWEAVAAGGCVAVEGCYVFLVIAEAPEKILAKGREMVQ